MVLETMKYIYTLTLIAIVAIMSSMTTVDTPVAKIKMATKEDVIMMINNPYQFPYEDVDGGWLFTNVRNGDQYFLRAMAPEVAALYELPCNGQGTNCGAPFWSATCGCQARTCVIYIGNTASLCRQNEPCPYCGPQ